MTYFSEASTTIPDLENTIAEPFVCWSCSAPLQRAALYCAACGRIQPLFSGTTYFEAFGLTRRLRMNVIALEREFYRLSRRLHPDVYARASQQEQQWSLANSSLVNDAYRTLRDPVRRTEYLLKLEGILSTEDGGETKEQRIPADLLEEVFELNMQLDEMRMSRQVSESDPQLHRDLLAAKVNFDAQLNAVEHKLEDLWDEWDESLDAGDEPGKTTVKQALVGLLDRLRYIRNLVKSVDEALAI